MPRAHRHHRLHVGQRLAVRRPPSARAQKPSARSSPPAATSSVSAPVESWRARTSHPREPLLGLGQHGLRDVVHAGRHPQSQLPPLSRVKVPATSSTVSAALTAARAGRAAPGPHSASRTLLRVRSNTSRPSCASRRAICWLSAGWVDVQPLGRPAEVQLVGEHHEGTQQTRDRHSCAQLITRSKPVFPQTSLVS